jgi:hypothetical protein
LRHDVPRSYAGCEVVCSERRELGYACGGALSIFFLVLSSVLERSRLTTRKTLIDVRYAETFYLGVQDLDVLLHGSRQFDCGAAVKSVETHGGFRCSVFGIALDDKLGTLLMNAKLASCWIGRKEVCY